MRWLIGGAGPVEVEVAIGLAKGVFTFDAETGSGEDVEFEADVLGESIASWRLDVAERTICKVQIGLIFAAADQKAKLAVRKGGDIVRCQDDLGNVLNKDGDGYAPVQIGAVKAAEGLVKLFRIVP